MAERRLFSKAQHSGIGTEQTRVGRSKQIHSAVLRRTPVHWWSGNLLLRLGLHAYSAHSARRAETATLSHSSIPPLSPSHRAPARRAAPAAGADEPGHFRRTFC